MSPNPVLENAVHLVTLLILLSIVASVLSCSSVPRSQVVEDKFEISEVSLERSGSWGLRSGYRVVLRRNGSAEYAGEVDAKRKGKFHGTVSQAQFDQLTNSLIENSYFSLADKYHALVTDTDTVTTIVVFKGGRKTVEDFGRGGGEGLTKVEQAIDNLAEQVAWVKDGG